jgi:tRNA(adenine34) deaminase
MNHDYFMNIALKEASKASKKGEVPVGAVIVKDNQIIAKAHNKRQRSNRTIAHAEILAIEKANKKLKSWRLDRCVIYVTIEPCPMCSGAIIQSRIDTLVYGAKDDKAGCHDSITNLFEHKFNHKVNIISGILEEESSNIIKTFFRNLRIK